MAWTREMTLSRVVILVLARLEFEVVVEFNPVIYQPGAGGVERLVDDAFLYYKDLGTVLCRRFIQAGMVCFCPESRWRGQIHDALHICLAEEKLERFFKGTFH